MWVNLLCATYTGGRADGSTYDGIVPFTTADDLATPNEAFFTRVDHMLNLAAAHGIVVLLDPAETGSYPERAERQRHHQGPQLRPLPRNALSRASTTSSG